MEQLVCYHPLSLLQLKHMNTLSIIKNTEALSYYFYFAENNVTLNTN